jgi:hypothetical protein
VRIVKPFRRNIQPSFGRQKCEMSSKIQEAAVTMTASLKMEDVHHWGGDAPKRCA